MDFIQDGKHIKYSVKDLNLFEEGSFSTKDLGNGINLILGKEKSSGQNSVHSVAWGVDQWNMETAQKWWEEHKSDFETNQKSIKTEDGKLHNITGVEVFSAGTWNGDQYTEKDLDEMVTAFNENKVGFRPPLKLGHTKDQKFAQQDGLPAIGWIDKVYRVGNKLLADFVDIPSKIATLIEKKSYRKVSSEVYWNIKIGEKTYSRLLGAVALLGADMPGVMNLNDILGLYTRINTGGEIKSYAKSENEFTIKTYDSFAQEKKENEMPTIEELQAELAKKDAELKTFSANQESKDAEIKKLQEQNEKFQKEALEAKQKEELAEVKKFTTELKAEKLCTPAMEKIVEELLIEPEKKEYSVGEKKGSKQEALKELLKLYKAAAEVNFDENSGNGGGDKKLPKEDMMIAEIEKYMADNKCDYRVAHRAVAHKYAEATGNEE